MRLLLIFLITYSFAAHAAAVDSNTVKKSSAKRYWNNGIHKHKWFLVNTTATALAGYSIYRFYQEWYSQYETAPFHTVNDLKHWKQMDKLGHITSANSSAEKIYYALRWSGVPQKRAAITSTISTWSLMASIDIMDGFSSQWGFSPSDIVANTTGSFLFMLQTIKWGEQKMIIKWSYHDTPEVKDYNKLNRLGSGLTNNWLHNYNGQTYWLTLNSNCFAKPRKTWQKILGVSVGLGAQGMIHETNNSTYSNYYPEANEIERYRQWYISPDLDLTHIRVRSKFLKGIFYLTRFFKSPLPTIEFNKIDGARFHLFYW